MAKSNNRLDREYQLIDKVLQDKSEDVKQQVWEFVARFDIHPDDQAFWALFVMMGYLQKLMSDSPAQWTDLFTRFQRELADWAQTNNKTLAQLGHKTDVMNKLSQSSEKLESILFKLTEESHRLMLTLQQQTAILNAAINQRKNDTLTIERALHRLQDHLDQQKQQIQAIGKALAIRERREQAKREGQPPLWLEWVNAYAIVPLMVVLILGTGFSIGQNLHMVEVLHAVRRDQMQLLQRSSHKKVLPGSTAPQRVRREERPQ